MIVAAYALLCVYLIAINAAAFVLFGLDKRRSEHNQRRIAERKLLSVAFWGGSLGAMIGQQFYRHKTRKQPFRSRLTTIVLLQIVFSFLLAIPMLRSFALKLFSDLIAFF